MQSLIEIIADAVNEISLIQHVDVVKDLNDKHISPPRTRKRNNARHNYVRRDSDSDSSPKKERPVKSEVPKSAKFAKRNMMEASISHRYKPLPPIPVKQSVAVSPLLTADVKSEISNDRRSTPSIEAGKSNSHVKVSRSRTGEKKQRKPKKILDPKIAYEQSFVFKNAQLKRDLYTSDTPWEAPSEASSSISGPLTAAQLRQWQSRGSLKYPPKYAESKPVSTPITAPLAPTALSKFSKLIRGSK